MVGISPFWLEQAHVADMGTVFSASFKDVATVFEFNLQRVLVSKIFVHGS